MLNAHRLHTAVGRRRKFTWSVGPSFLLKMGSVSPILQMSKLTPSKSHLPKVTQLLSVYLHLKRKALMSVLGIRNIDARTQKK